MNENIFNYLYPSDNTNLNELNKQDLYKILLLINKYDLEYRNTLNIDNDITFGLEIEFEDTKYEKVNNLIEQLNLQNLPWTKTKWITTDERSINYGGETKSPILKDDIQTWKQLKQVLTIINKEAKIKNASSGHIHIGKQALKDNLDSWINFVKLWIAYENIIYRFGYNEYLNARPTLNQFAGPIAKELQKDMKKKYKNHEQIIKTLNQHCRTYAFNVDHIKSSNLYKSEPIDTIEFRNFNASFNEIIWQNNTNFITKFLSYCNKTDFDMDTINKRIKKNTNVYTFPIYSYHQINIKQAIELSDLIFNNNLDKIYFLRQYFKSFQTNENGRGLLAWRQ